MQHNSRIPVSLAVATAMTASFIIPAGNAAGARLAAHRASEGHRLAEAWCSQCHAMEPNMTGLFDQAPSFEAIANRHGTTALSLKIFLRTSHQDMPDLVITPDQADALANYILSLKTD